MADVITHVRRITPMTHIISTFFVGFCSLRFRRTSEEHARMAQTKVDSIIFKLNTMSKSSKSIWPFSTELSFRLVCVIFVILLNNVIDSFEFETSEMRMV